MGRAGKRAKRAGQRTEVRAPAVSACASGQCVRQRLTRIMPVYQLDFDWFEKSVWFGGKIEYCAIAPYIYGYIYGYGQGQRFESRPPQN